jgi:excinuclease UvrABC nuclease subunit
MMYYDEHGRLWEGPYPFTLFAITTHAPKEYGVYQVLFSKGGPSQVAYIGIATGDTIYGRLRKHCMGSGNWALGRIVSAAYFNFVFYVCDSTTAKQIESHVVTTRKPPFNVKPEYKHYIPSIAVH